MFKIRKLHAKDRLLLYKMLQQNEQLDQKEIDLELARIDEALFNKPKSKVWVVIALNQEKQIAGYASYGVKPLMKKTFEIFNIIISPLATEQRIGEILLDYIEHDIQKKQGHLILAEIQSIGFPEHSSNFFKEHQYSQQKFHNEFDKSRKEKLFYTKEI